jgi:hypothetical protein
MTYVVADMAEAQAIGLCWLSRQPGLPEVHTLRAACAQLHARACGWCAYPLPELMRMLVARQVSDRAEREWWHIPGQARLRAIELAQGADQA